ncbi:MAG: hypothetical protein JWR19_3857, partial [Pedosphaera sp.]|nr:hypothetical protein [Pedosphaera sp.]
MSSSGVTADVLTAFVSDAVTTFNLTSENVIYLQRIGLPAQVVTAMLVHDKELKDNAALQQLQQQQQAAPAEMPPTNQPPDMGQETPPYSNDNYYPSGYGYGWFPFLNSDFGFGSGFGSGFGFGDFNHRFNDRFEDRFNHRFNDRFDDRFANRFNRRFNDRFNHRFNDRFDDRFSQTFFPNNFNNFNGFNRFDGFNRFNGFNGIAPNRLFLNGRNFAQPSTAESLTFDPRFPNFRAGARLPNSNFAFRSGRFPHTFFPNS